MIQRHPSTPRNTSEVSGTGAAGLKLRYQLEGNLCNDVTEGRTNVFVELQIIFAFRGYPKT